MGKNIKVICTVVPNGMNAQGKPRFSVFLTPRLPEPGNMKDYYEILYWPQFIDFFTRNQYMQVSLANMKADQPNSYTVSNEVYNAGVVHDTSICNMGSDDSFDYKKYYGSGADIWKKLIRSDTPVEAWQVEDGPGEKTTPVFLFGRDDIENIKNNKNTPAGNNKGITDSLGSTKGFQAVHQDAVARDTQKKFNDIKANVLSPEEIRAGNKENQEFHKKISILADYPHLLRRLGWIFDFTVDIDLRQKEYNLIKLDFGSTPQFVIEANETEKWANYFNELDFKTPWTYFNKNDFSIRYLESFTNSYFSFNRGVIQKEASNYKLEAVQFDIRKSALKVDNSNLTDDERKIIKQEYVSQPETNSNGIGIFVRPKNAAEAPVKKAMENSPEHLNNSILVKNPGDSKAHKNEDANIDDYIIFGHHLDTGYRIDVAGEGSKDFRSLCRRIADYAIDLSPNSAKSKTQVFLKDFEDEPWIAESAQSGKTGKLYVDEELTRWNNWSITCPHVGNYPQDEELDETVKEEYNDLELQDIRPPSDSLLPMRFGGKYRFMIRVVDICGNGRKTIAAAEIDEYVNCIVESTPYYRLESVNAPELYLTENIYTGKVFTKKGDGGKQFLERSIKPAFYGEDAVTLVIRSTISDSGIDSPEKCVRAVAPPRVNYQFAELHGVFDNDFRNGNYEAIYKKAIAADKDASREIFRETDEIEHFTDPLADGIYLTIPAIKADEVRKSFGGYHDRKYMRLRLENVVGAEPESIIIQDNGLDIRLKPGSVYKGTIESELDFIMMEAMHSTPDPAVITKPKQLQFIYAVQKPVIIPPNGTASNFIQYFKNLNASIIDRTPLAPIDIRFDQLSFPEGFPVSTSAEFILEATYHDIVLDPEKDTGFDIKTVTASFGFQNYDESNDLKSKNDTEGNAFLSTFNKLTHSFNDTRFRIVQYELEAVSRFKEFFPGETEFSVFGNFTEKTTNLAPMIIRNSKKPDAVAIDHIVPVLEWVIDGEYITRSQSVFRVYLGKEWYLTGADEKIAVLFLDRKEGEENTIFDDCEGLVSEFGADPSTKSYMPEAAGNKFFRPSEFEEALEGNFTIVGDKVDDKIAFRLLERTETKFITPFPASKDGRDIKAVVYPVKYDKGKKMFYADITVNVMKNYYMPFFKFAICRYQQHSIKDVTTDPDGKLSGSYDFRFSPVVMSPQVQLLPTRTVNKDTKNFEPTPIAEHVKLKNLEYYLLLEKQTEVEFAKLVTNGKVLNSIAAMRLDSRENGDLKLKSDSEVAAFLKKQKYVNAYLEEYEVYEVDLSFKMDERGTYNPRNDIRKRMVYSYKIE